MGAMIYNPMILNSAVPGGSNPTGTSISVPSSPTPASGVSSPGSSNPYLASLNPTGNTNPYTSGIAVPGSSSPSSSPSMPAYSSPYGSGTIPTPNISTPATTNTAQNGPNGTLTSIGLTNEYGNLGSLVQQLLQSNGGYNAQVVQALLAQMQPGVEAGQQNILQEFSAGGGRFSSDAELGLSSYNSQVQLNQDDIMAQLYEQAYENYMNEVMGVAGQKVGQLESQPSVGDLIASIAGSTVQAAGTAAGGYLSGL